MEIFIAEVFRFLSVFSQDCDHGLRRTSSPDLFRRGFIRQEYSCSVAVNGQAVSADSGSRLGGRPAYNTSEGCRARLGYGFRGPDYKYGGVAARARTFRPGSLPVGGAT